MRRIFNSWSWERDEVGVSLKEWVLCVRHHPSLRTDNLILNTLSKIWRKMQDQLAPGISLLSFLYHPSFQIAASLSNGSPWKEKGLDQFFAWGRSGTCIPL